MNINSEPNLVRGISRFDMLAITINSIIGAGIFGLPSKAAALIGANSLFAFIVCAFVVALIVLCFAEVSSRFTETGGPYLYAKEAFGSIVGFEVGWLFWLVRITAFATNCNLLVNYPDFACRQRDRGNNCRQSRAVIAVSLIASIINRKINCIAHHYRERKVICRLCAVAVDTARPYLNAFVQNAHIRRRAARVNALKSSL
ncbi:MAG: APC family permease [Pyrinomonadaceae bacterium]